MEILTCLLKMLLYHYFPIVILELQIYYNKPYFDKVSDSMPDFSFIRCIDEIGFSPTKLYVYYEIAGDILGVVKAC